SRGSLLLFSTFILLNAGAVLPGICFRSLFSALVFRSCAFFRKITVYHGNISVGHHRVGIHLLRRRSRRRFRSDRDLKVLFWRRIFFFFSAAASCRGYTKQGYDCRRCRSLNIFYHCQILCPLTKRLSVPV